MAFYGAIVYELPITTPILEAGNYVDINPGIQCISGPRTELTCLLAFPYQPSYNHLYPDTC